MNKTVSIITPAYNCSTTIENTYKSILQQTYKDWEWIIVEDCSIDNSYSYIKELIKNDKRVLLLRNEHNSGAAVARNKGIKEAKGRYIAFLDADDTWDKDKLLKQIQFMDDNQYVFTFTNYYVKKRNGKISKYRVKKKSITYKDLLKTNRIGCLTVVYDTLALGKVLMPEDCYKREDHAAWLDITRLGNAAYHLDEFLSTYQVNEHSVSFNKVHLLKYQYRVYRNHLKFIFIKSIWYLFVCSLHKMGKYR